MGNIDFTGYILAIPLTLIETFGGGLLILAAILGVVGLWLCRSLFSGMSDRQ